jgi:hypothetical protein
MPKLIYQLILMTTEMPKSIEKGKEASNPLTPIQIEKTMGEKMTHIPKGAFQKDSHNPNTRVA